MKQLQEAFDALLPTNEQEERMLCEILVARNGKPKRRSRNNPIRVAVLIAAVLTLCVVTASAAEILGVSQMIRDYFQKKEEVSVMDKLNVAAKGLSTTTEDGWTFTITDLFGDYNRMMMGVTLEAPEGTILNESDYNLYLSTKGSPDTMPSGELDALMEDFTAYSDTNYDTDCFIAGYLQKDAMSADQVPDDNPNDNKISFVFDERLDYYQDGIAVDFHFETLRRYPVVGTYIDYTGEIQDDHEQIIVKEFDATIPGVATHFSSNGYHLTPNTSVQAFGGNATVSKLTFTPLSVSFELTGDSVNQMLALPDEEGYDSEKMRSLRPTRRERYQRWWDARMRIDEKSEKLVPVEKKDVADLDEHEWFSWADHWQLDTPLVLHFKDGTSQELDLFLGDYRHDNNNADINEIVEGEKKVIASYRFDTPLDMDTVDYITVCDVRVSLPAEAVK